MPNLLYDALFRPHEKSARTFLVLKDGRTVSYQAFLGMAARFAHALADAGVGIGDRVAVQAKKSPEALALYAACVEMGAVLLPLNTAYTPVEVDYFVTDSGARLLICDGGSRAALEPVAAKAGARLLTLNDDGSGTLTEAANGKPDRYDPAERGADDLAAFLYTSGTTGRSKGAMLSHDNLLSNAAALVETWRFTADDVLLHALPIFHTHGLFVACNVMLLAGGSMIFLPALDVDDLVANMGKATTMMGVPTFYTRLLADPRLDRKLVAHIRLFVSGSAPLLAETHAEFEARTGHRILERYGMTETNMNASNPYDGERRAGTVGLPLPGVELRVADPETRQAHRPRRDRHYRGARPQRLQGLLEHAGEDQGGVSRRRLLHHRRPRPDRRRRLCHDRRPRQGPGDFGRLQHLPEGGRDAARRRARRAGNRQSSARRIPISAKAWSRS